MRTLPSSICSDKHGQGPHAEKVYGRTVGLRQAAVEEPHVLGKGLADVWLLSRARHIDDLRHRQERHQRVGRGQRADVHAGADLLRQLRRCCHPIRRLAMPHGCSTSCHQPRQSGRLGGCTCHTCLGNLPVCLIKHNLYSREVR